MTDHTVSSHSRRSGAARLWRGWVIALLAVALAAGGHQAAHSITHGATEALSWQLLGFSAALTAPVAVALAGGRIATWSTAVTTIVGQLAFHLLYSLPYTGSSDLPNAQHHGHHAPTPILESQAAHLEHAASSSMAADTVMLVAHVLAAAMTTWIIVHGERSLVTIVAWLLLVPIKLVLATLPVSTARPKLICAAGRVWIPHPMNIAQTRWTRGPPALA